MRVALGFPADVELIVRIHRSGVDIAYAIAIDQMLGAAEMSEWAVLSAVECLAGRAPLPLEPKRNEVEAILASERSPRLLLLVDEAKRRGLPLLWDDEIVSIGSGRRSVSFPKTDLPEVGAVLWEAIGTIPIAMVTGTNGKTTSSRLLARMGTEALLRVAITSSDGIAVGAETLEDGDWTGPSAARIALRRNDVDLAVLETARGGILRRGLAVDTCDAALLTNVSDDHLGLYGIDDVRAMAEVKGVVARAVGASGMVVLNARDANLVHLAQELPSNVTWFADLDGPQSEALDAARSVIETAAARGQRAVVARDGEICAGSAADALRLRVADVPITFGGAARHNVENVLGAVAMALSLDLPRDAIERALRGFAMHDNPGRGQRILSGGVTVILDFGHNPEGVRAVMSLVESLRQEKPQGRGRLTVVTASPGDRTDEQIASVARIVYESRPDQVYTRELDGYLRGRAPGEVSALFQRSLLALGMPPASFALVRSEVDALERAFVDAQPGDFVVVLVHIDKEAVHALLSARG